MSGVPDYTLEDTLDFKFTTRQFSTGAPFAFAAGAIEIYEDNDTAQITGAETLTLEFDGVTGLHNLRVAATAANGFENGKSYHCVVSAGSVDSVSVVGEVVQQFSIGRSAAAVDLANGTDGLGAIKAETALIVGDTGELQTDWVEGGRLDNILDARMAEASIDTTGGAVDTVTTNSDMRGTDSALLAASAPANFGDLSIVVTTGLVDITQAAADKVWASASRTLTAFSTALALSVWDVLESAVVTASSMGLKVKNNLDAAITSRAQAGDAMTLTAAERDATADALLNRDMAAVTVTNTRSPINALRLLRNKWSIPAGVLTVTEEDDTTTAWTGTVTTDAAADPVTAVDPA